MTNKFGWYFTSEERTVEPGGTRCWGEGGTYSHLPPEVKIAEDPCTALMFGRGYVACRMEVLGTWSPVCVAPYQTDLISPQAVRVVWMEDATVAVERFIIGCIRHKAFMRALWCPDQSAVTPLLRSADYRELRAISPVSKVPEKLTRWFTKTLAEADADEARMLLLFMEGCPDRILWEYFGNREHRELTKLLELTRFGHYQKGEVAPSINER